MFTGIVEEVGTVEAVESVADKRRIRIAATATLSDLEPGASIAVNGVCQTVVERDDVSFTVEAIPTTLGRTTLGRLAAGDGVNLERPLALGDRLGGHLVQGHVDGVATVRRVDRLGEHTLVDIAVPTDVAQAAVPRGSIAMDGVSLTINDVPAPDVLQVALIPFTLEHTTLSDLVPGSEVNVEGDLVGKMLSRFAEQWLSAREAV